jgi:hypothetical protein
MMERVERSIARDEETQQAIDRAAARAKEIFNLGAQMMRAQRGF